MSSYDNIHQTFLFELTVTCVGFKFPFLAECHCAASSGFIVARSLKPSHTAFPLKYGQFFPLLRSLIAAFHSKSKCFFVLGSSYANIHQTFLSVLTVTCVGFKFPFLVGCHCFASSGFTVCKSLNPYNTVFPAKYGQPLLLLRLETLAFHSNLKCFCVFGSLYNNSHHAFLFELTVPSVGFKFPFLVGCHCFASSGFNVCKSLNPDQTAVPLK